VTGKPRVPKQPGSTRTRLIFAIRIWLVPVSNIRSCAIRVWLVAVSSRSVRVKVRFNSSNQS